ncbi:MAG: hypothetical protein ACRDD1_07675 [Planctomycetia bacterium]
MTNQWPKFDTLRRPKTIKSVITDEGSGIAERTNNQITFIVDSEHDGETGFLHRCYLFVPQVGYKFQLLRVFQNDLTYPAKVITDTFPKGVEVKDEKELRKALGEVFSSDVVMKVVPQLMELGT